MVSDRLVYRAADRILALFGESAPDEVSPLIREAIGQHDRDRAILLFRIRVAILLMQSPPSQVSHKAGDGRYTFGGLSLMRLLVDESPHRVRALTQPRDCLRCRLPRHRPRRHSQRPRRRVPP